MAFKQINPSQLTAKQQMKQVRDYLRREKRYIARQWPQLANRILIEMPVWDESSRRVLICVRDSQAEFTSYNSERCRYIVAYTWMSLNRIGVWTELNKLIVSLRQELNIK